MDYEKFLSKIGKKRIPSPLRELFDEFGAVICHMAGGLPNPEIFPIRSATLKLRDGSELGIDEEAMAFAMQYNTTSGNDELRAWFRKLIHILHDPPTMRDCSHPGQLDIKLANGAQDCIFRLVELLLDEGDTVIMETTAYPGFVSTALPTGCHIVTADSDYAGMIPESLSRLLLSWPKKGESTPANKSKLKALYCVPNGSNPTGSRYTVERKRAIYKLAQEYDFLIIEDDAYYFLEQRPLLPSFLSMDVDGRVLRIDTFSKTVAPGLRIGAISGPGPLMDKVRLGLHASTQGCSGVTQMMLLLLLKKLGHEGYIKHCEDVAQYYDKKRQKCEQIAGKYLSGLAEWHSPTGGMFLWVKFLGLTDTYELVMKKLVQRGVLIVAGAAFLMDTEDPSPYVRVSFSKASVEEMDLAFSIIAEEVTNLQKINQNSM